MPPTTTKQWQITTTERGVDGLELQEVQIPALGENDVLVRIHAVSLNFRDLMLPKGTYPFPMKLPIVACSDGAGEVIDIGRQVKRWSIGDRVITLFSPPHLYGPSNPTILRAGLGGGEDGTLRQYAVFNEQGLIRSPQNLNFREASTLTCAALTSWNALYGLRPLKPGETVLVLGTGGVSIFALQFAKAAGATVIATTSSKSKADLLRKLGASYVVHYNEDPEWGLAVKALSPNGEGVDHIVEIGGLATLGQSIKAIKPEGIISVAGAVADGEPKDVPSLLECWKHNCIARGIAIGSRLQAEDMVAAIEANDIHPLVDERQFSFEQVKDAYHYFDKQQNLGKTVIMVED